MIDHLIQLTFALGACAVMVLLLKCSGFIKWSWPAVLFATGGFALAAWLSLTLAAEACANC